MFESQLRPIIDGIGVFLAVIVALWVLNGLMRTGTLYGWSWRLFADAMRFAWRRRLFWWQRTPPLFEIETKIFVGLPGSGKTLLLCQAALQYMRQGVRVVSSFTIVDPITGEHAVLMRSWFDFLAYSVDAVARGVPTVFVIDEIQNWAPARFFNKTPGWWLGIMAQRRHLGVGILGTAQYFGQVESAFRRLTDRVTFVRHLQEVPLFGRRLPILVTATCAAAGLQPDALGPLPGTKKEFHTVPWYVYAGYSTAETCAVEEWGEDQDVSYQITALTLMSQRLTLARDFDTVVGKLKIEVEPGERELLVQTLLRGMDPEGPSDSASDHELDVECVTAPAVLR